MPAQNPNPNSPADATPQGTAPPGGQPPASGGTNPPLPQVLSGTWFEEEYPQFLMQWILNPPTPGPPPTPYTAQVGVYQLIFNTVIPSPLPAPAAPSGLTDPDAVQPSATDPASVPFSLTDPAYGTTPYLQGSLVLSQSPSLEVVNLQFPGFQAPLIFLVAPPAPGPTGTGSSPSTGTGTGGSTVASGGGTSSPGESSGAA
jgi:hypothetical protein